MSSKALPKKQAASASSGQPWPAVDSVSKQQAASASSRQHLQAAGRLRQQQAASPSSRQTPPAAGSPSKQKGVRCRILKRGPHLYEQVDHGQDDDEHSHKGSRPQQGQRQPCQALRMQSGADAITHALA